MNSRNVVLFALIAALALAACSPAAMPATSAAPTATALVSMATSIPEPTAAPGFQSEQWDQPPAMTIDPQTIYVATFKTIKGEIEVQLFADKAPVTVNNFIFLAREGFYDNTTFHRVLTDFMAQGGDPTATGSGGPGYEFDNEIHPDLTFGEAGLLAMANAGPDTNGSQFFITTVPTPHLNGGYTIFGKVVEGMDVVLALTLRDPNENPTFSGDLLKTVEISESATSLLPPPTATPLPVTPVAAEGRPLAKLEVADRENLYNAPCSTGSGRNAIAARGKPASTGWREFCFSCFR